LNEQQAENLGNWSAADAWRELSGVYLDAARLSEAPRWQPDAEPELTDPLAELLMPGVGRLMMKERYARALLHGTLVQLAAHASWVAEGDPPGSLEDLVPHYLPRVPIDPFSGEPMLWGQRYGTWRVYSVGPDLEDNGGESIGRVVKDDSVGDIVVEVAFPDML